jgi:type III secretion protein V
MVALLVAPLPSAILDGLLAANVAAAAAVLLVAIFASDVGKLASFPALILLSTLFRLSLSVSSTRLILSRGEGSAIIEGFGRVVVQGSYVVGGVVFAIITLVQLLVVAKGAERVAEVAARFTLDSLPGKQMAIDADLRSGLLTPEEARRRRRLLERESHLYGAMDGALKFVRGDAIAGLAIVAVNMAGGVISGLDRGMTFAAAARRFALLAIGDGLVTQIPALLNAVAAGIVVTRVVAEEDGGSLGREIGSQLLGEPRALWAAAALCLGLGTVPGLPIFPFAVLALCSAGAAHSASRRESQGSLTAIGDAKRAKATPQPLPLLRPVIVELSDDLLSGALGGGDGWKEATARVREGLWLEMGIRLPAVALRARTAPPGSWRLLINELPTSAGTIEPGRALAFMQPSDLAVIGIPADPIAIPFCRDGVAASIPASRSGQVAALATVLDSHQWLVASLTQAFRENASRLVGMDEARLLLDGLEHESPSLAREIERQIPHPLLTDVLRRLLEEQISIRPFKTIAEAMIEAGALPGPALAERCRCALGRHIVVRHMSRGELPALLLDPELETTLRDVHLSPERIRTFLEGVAAALLGGAPERPVLLTTQATRRATRNLVATDFPNLAVLGSEELPPELRIRPLGVAKAARSPQNP